MCIKTQQTQSTLWPTTGNLFAAGNALKEAWCCQGIVTIIFFRKDCVATLYITKHYRPHLQAAWELS